MKVLGLPPGTLRIFRTSQREAVRSNRTCNSLVKSPPSSLASITWRKAGGVRASSPPGSRLDGSSTLRSRTTRGTGAELEESRAANRRGGGRTDRLHSYRRNYNLQHPFTSTCLLEVHDSLGLLRWSPRCCSAPAGQVEKVSGPGLLEWTPMREHVPAVVWACCIWLMMTHTVAADDTLG